MKKVFIQCMFGAPFPWIEKYIDNVQGLDGWEWKIFTPEPISSRGNVEIIPMTTEKFCDLTEEKLGVRPNMFITPMGVPSVHISDFYVASGVIFEDYLTNADFWGITNLDVVYGALDHFLPDSFLADLDVFSDDIRTINGVFCLFRNIPKVNNLFKEIPDWKIKFSQPPCPRCLEGGKEKHVLFGTDEYDLTEVVRNHPDLRFGYPKFYPLHGHDRLMQHVPTPRLDLKEDHSLWELSADINPPRWIHQRPFFGREIMYFHFNTTKKWPL